MCASCLGRKRSGRKRAFAEPIELAIAIRYLVDDVTSGDVADEFRVFSRTKELSASGVRLIARRYRDKVSALNSKA